MGNQACYSCPSYQSRTNIYYLSYSIHYKQQAKSRPYDMPRISKRTTAKEVQAITRLDDEEWVHFNVICSRFVAILLLTYAQRATYNAGRSVRLQNPLVNSWSDLSKGPKEAALQEVLAKLEEKEVLKYAVTKEVLNWRMPHVYSELRRGENPVTSNTSLLHADYEIRGEKSGY